MVSVKEIEVGCLCQCAGSIVQVVEKEHWFGRKHFWFVTVEDFLKHEWKLTYRALNVLPDLYPIVLTPEIMKRCGYEHKGNGVYMADDYRLKGEDMPLVMLNIGLKEKTHYEKQPKILHCRYLHELQNFNKEIAGRGYTPMAICEKIECLV
jgi:hypothetical protein